MESSRMEAMEATRGHRQRAQTRHRAQTKAQSAQTNKVHRQSAQRHLDRDPACWKDFSFEP